MVQVLLLGVTAAAEEEASSVAVAVLMMEQLGVDKAVVQVHLL
jgi:hypothetical protein